MKRYLTGIGPILGMVALLLVSLALMSDATQGSTRFGELYSVLLMANAAGMLLLAWLIGWNLYRLITQVRTRRPGARLTARMVTIFVILAVTPVLVVYYFSLQFLHRGIDSWFDVRIERALDGALELSRTALEVRMRELLKQTEVMAAGLGSVPGDQIAGHLDDARRLSGAAELTLIGGKGEIVAFSNIDPTAIVPDQPTDAIIGQLRQSGDYIGLDPIGDAGLHIRVAVTLPEEVPTPERRLLQGLFPISERMDTLADSVESAYGKYRELAYLRKPLKISFTLILSLVLLLSLLTAVWAAFYSARRVVAPLRELAQGTRAVAAGDYETRLAGAGKDEVGFLVESFNEMTRELARARDEARQSQNQVEEQRQYLQAVLGRLSTGVITLDGQLRLHTANHAAGQILELPLDSETGNELAAVFAAHAHLQPLADALRSRLEGPPPEGGETQDWREEITVSEAGGRKILIVSGTTLPSVDPVDPLLVGHVIVFDDVTALVQAQRDAAWSEVARRLAHEIKNPLTPIQLSAERLRHKYLNTMPSGEGEVLDRLTRTIVQQVEAMKEMVNEFSEYARAPRVQITSIDFNELVADILELYRNEHEPVVIETCLDSNLPTVEADAGRLRQLLHNLVKNALEASLEPGSAKVTISTAITHESQARLVEVRVSDAGPGIAPDIVDRVFEPYVTTKPRGTGLGLAIVKKIAEEHGGVVWAENNEDAGARIVLRIPATAPAPATPAATPAPMRTRFG